MQGSELVRARTARNGETHMKTRVTVEYNLPAGDRVAVRDQEEQRWITSQTVLALPGSATVKVELLEAPLMPVM
jgi:hypothetical protein